MGRNGVKKKGRGLSDLLEKAVDAKPPAFWDKLEKAPSLAPLIPDGAPSIGYLRELRATGVQRFKCAAFEVDFGSSWPRDPMVAPVIGAVQAAVAAERVAGPLVIEDEEELSPEELAVAAQKEKKKYEDTLCASAD